MQSLPHRTGPLTREGLGGRKLPLGFQQSLLSSPESEQLCCGAMLECTQGLGSYSFVSLSDLILMFKNPLAGKLGGREVSSKT